MINNQYQNNLINKCDSNNKVQRLSEKELRCLYLTFEGKKSQEIAIILNISIYTVHTYKRRIMTKFQCKTMSHAIYKGIEHGLLKG